MSYSRRQLYAMGETLGESVTRRKATGGFIYGGGGGSQQTTVSSTELPSWAQPYAQTALQNASALTSQQYQPYQGNRIAGFSPLQQYSQDQATQMQPAQQLQNATQLANQAGLVGMNTAYGGQQFGNTFQAPGQYNPGQFSYLQTQAPDLQNYQMQAPQNVSSQSLNTPMMQGQTTNYNPNLQNFQMQGPQQVSSQNVNAGNIQAAQSNFNPNLQSYQMQAPQAVQAQNVQGPVLNNLSMQAANNIQGQQINAPMMSAAQTAFNPNLQNYQMGQGPQVNAPSLQNYQMQGPQNVSARDVNAPNIQALSMQAAGNVNSQGVTSQDINAAQTNYNPNLQSYQMQGPQNVSSQNFDTNAAQQYMNPYLQQALNPQIEEAKRQSAIQQTQLAGQAVGAGAFGGSRFALQQAEANRNLGTNLANITGQGYNQAYNQAQQAFQADQARQLQAQQANQQAGLTTGQQNLQANLATQQLGTQTGAQMALANLNNQQQAAVQSEANRLQAQGMTSQQALQAALANQQTQQQANLQNLSAGLQAQGLQAQTGMQAQQANQQAGLQAALANQQAGMTAGQQNLQANLATQQLGAQTGLQAQLANQQAGLTAGQQNLQANLATQQLGTQTGLQAALANLNNQQQANVQNQATQFQAQGMTAQQAMQAALANQQNQQQANLQNLSAGLQTQGLQAQTGLQAQQANQQANLQAGLANQQAGLTTGQQNLNANLATQQLGAQTGLQQSLANLNAQQQANVQNVANQLQASGMNSQQALQAALANQQAGLTTGQQNLSANLQTQQLGTQTGLQTALANLNSQQQAAVQNQAAQLQTQGMSAQQALQAALANQQAGLTTGQQNLAANLQTQQLGAGQNLQSQLANQQQYLAAQQAQQQANQFGYGQGMTAAQTAAQYGLGANQLNAQQQQFGASLGLQGAGLGLNAANTLGNLGQTQYSQNMGINQLQNQYGAQQQAQQQQGLSQAYQDFLNQQNFGYNQLGYMSNLIRGLPLGTTSNQQVYPGTANTLGSIAGLGLGAAGLANAYTKLQAKGGLTESYAEGGDVQSFGNIESIVHTLSDQQLAQAQRDAQSRNDNETLQAIMVEQGIRASERNGLAGAFNQQTQGQPVHAAKGGIMGFALGGEPTAEEIEAAKKPFVGYPKAARSPEANKAAVEASEKRSISDALIPKEYAVDKPKPEQVKADQARIMSDYMIQNKPEAKEEASPASISAALNKPSAPAISTSAAFKPDNSFQDNYHSFLDEYSKLNEPQQKAMDELVASHKKRIDDMQARGLNDALTQFGFQLAAAASKPGKSFLGAAGEAAPSITEALNKSQKSVSDEQDLLEKIQMDQARFNLAMKKGDMQSALGAAQGVSADRKAQQQLELQRQQLGITAQHYAKPSTATEFVYDKMRSDPTNKGMSDTKVMEMALRATTGYDKASLGLAGKANAAVAKVMEKYAMFDAMPKSEYRDSMLAARDREIAQLQGENQATPGGQGGNTVLRFDSKGNLISG